MSISCWKSFLERGGWVMSCIGWDEWTTSIENNSAREEELSVLPPWLYTGVCVSRQCSLWSVSTSRGPRGSVSIQYYPLFTPPHQHSLTLSLSQHSDLRGRDIYLKTMNSRKSSEEHSRPRTLERSAVDFIVPGPRSLFIWSPLIPSAPAHPSQAQPHSHQLSVSLKVYLPI